MHEGGEDPFEVGKGHALIHQQTLHLVKHGGVGDVRVPAVDLARGDDAHRGLALFHGADLHGGGVSPEEHLVGEVKGVLHVPGRVVRRQVEGLEVIPVQFHLGAFHCLKPQVQEDIADLGHDAVQGVETAPEEAPSRQGDVHRGSGGQAGRGFQGEQGLIQGGFYGRLDPVGFLAQPAAQFRVLVLQAPQDLGEVPFAAQMFDPQQFQFLRGPGVPNVLQCDALEAFDLVYGHPG